MNDPLRAFDLAERQLERDLNAGFISQKDFDEAMREMGHAYRDAAEEAAQAAYFAEKERW